MPDVEYEPSQKLAPEGVQEIPDVPELPPVMEQAGVKTVPSQVTQKVTDDQGQQLMQSPATQQVTIVIPTDPQKLANLTKGKAEDAITWLAVFWLRLLKKAMYFGWKIMSGQKSPA